MDFTMYQLCQAELYFPEFHVLYVYSKGGPQGDSPKIMKGGRGNNHMVTYTHYYLSADSTHDEATVEPTMYVYLQDKGPWLWQDTITTKFRGTENGHGLQCILLTSSLSSWNSSFLIVFPSCLSCELQPRASCTESIIGTVSPHNCVSQIPITKSIHLSIF